jgi:hypothetical protein
MPESARVAVEIVFNMTYLAKLRLKPTRSEAVIEAKP